VELDFSLKHWNILKDDKTGISTISGKYELLMNGKAIAGQEFNTSYNGTPIAFSGDLIQKIKSLEQEVIAEITKMLS